MNAAEKGARRRAASRPRPRLGRSAVAPAALVLLAAVALLITGALGATPQPDDATTASGGVVDHTTFACPDQPAGRRDSVTTDLGLARSPSDVTPPSGGALTAGSVDSTGRSVDLARGSLSRVSSDGGPAVDATGGSAAGLFGFRTDEVTGRTLGVGACPAPRARWWFTGAGAGLDHSSSLLIANLDPGPAVLDVHVLGPDGVVETVATDGITVAPHSVRRIDLADIAPQTDDLAVEVSASRGRVVASVTDSFAAQPSAQPSAQPGQEWLAATDRASRTLRLAGLPATSSSSTLLVANPSDLEATVDVRVAGKRGTFAPTGLSTITVAPGAIETVDLARVLPKKEPVALRLRSRVPVVASVRVTAGSDHAYATPVSPLVGPAAAPVVPGLDTTVQLTAGAVATMAAVVAYDAKGTRVDGTTLSIDATATAAWSPTKGAAYLVVTPSADAGAGTVHGAVSYSGGGLAAVPLTALPFRVERPQVAPALH
ncbi:MAG: DUF5719 family protein [Nocardioidaceae bacterium]